MIERVYACTVSKMRSVFLCKMTLQNLAKRQAKDDKYLILIIFIFSLALRLVYISTIRHLPLFDSPAMDADYHDQWARSIARGDFIGYGGFIRSPLYSYVLGFWYMLFGVNYYLVRVFFASIGSISIVLIFQLARYLFNRTSAFFAAIIAALTWTFIYYDAELLDSSLALLISLICVFVLLKTFVLPTKKGYFLTGLMFGVGALARDNYLPVIAIVFVWLIFYYRKHFKRAIAFGGLFLCGAILVILPVTIRNAVVLKDFIPISCYTGVNFYIGNNPYADGRTAIVPGTREDWWGGVEDVIYIAEGRLHRRLKPSQVSLFWAKEAAKYIRANFARSCLFTLKKFLFIFDLNETSNNQNIYFFRNQSKLLRLPVFFSAWFYIPLGFLGMYLSVRDKKKNILPVFVFLLAYCLPLSLFFVFTRVRQPVMSFFIIFSGYALVRSSQLLKINRSYFFKALILYLAIFTALSFNSSKIGTLKDGHFTLGNAYIRKGNFVKARFELSQAMGLPESYRSRIYFQLGYIEMKEKKYHAAADDFKRAIGSNEQLAPQVDEFLTRSLFSEPFSPLKLSHPEEKSSFEPFAETFFLIGNQYAFWQEYGSAESAYGKSLALKEEADTNVNLGNVFSITNTADPVIYYLKAIELNQESLPAYFNLSRELAKQNKLAEALSLLKKAIVYAKSPQESEALNLQISEIEGRINR